MLPNRVTTAQPCEDSSPCPARASPSIPSRTSIGLSAESIASTLIISPWMVRDHIKTIYRKTGVGALSALASLATGTGSV